MLIREITSKDADELLCLMKKVESESKFMLFEAGERKTTSKQVEGIIQQPHSTIFVAEDNGKLVGYLIAIGGNTNKTAHSAYLVIGILENYRRHGIGTTLFQQADKWALTCSISRLELTVVTQNIAGIALYKKCGFEVEGTKRDSLKIDEEFYNEYLMAKLL